MNDGQQQRAVDADATWSPFASATPVRETAEPARTPDADKRPSTVRADGGWNPVVIEGGRGHADAPAVDENASGRPDGEAVADAFDAAVADALAIGDPAPMPVDTGTHPASEPGAPEPEAVPVLEPESPAAAPAQAPEPAPQADPAPAAAPDSTLPTPHPETPPAAPTVPAHAGTETAETPHSTAPESTRVWSWRTPVAWLNLYQVLDQPLPPVRAIYESAWASVEHRTGLDRITEIAVVCGIGVPLSVAARIVDAAGHSKWRLLGLSATGLLWTLAAASAPVDASTLAWWTAFAYWASTVIVIPAVLKATE